MKKATLLFLIISNIVWGVMINAPKAPPSIPLLTMDNLDIMFYQDVSTEAVPKIIKREGELYILPVNVGALLYNKGIDIRILGVTSRGLLSFLSSSSDSIEALDGKKLYIGGQGSSPDVITRKILEDRKIAPEIIYRSSPEIGKLAMADKIENMILPEPLATMVLKKNSKIKRVSELKNMWHEGEIPQVGIFVMGKVYDENSREVINFSDEYKYAVETPLEDGVVDRAIKEFSLNLTREEFRESIKYMNLTFDPECRSSVERYLNALGVKLPGADFYVW